MSVLKCSMRHVSWCHRQYHLWTTSVCRMGLIGQNRCSQSNICAQFSTNVKQWTPRTLLTARCLSSGKPVAIPHYAKQTCMPHHCISSLHTTPPGSTGLRHTTPPEGGWGISDPYTNPLKELEPLLEAPLLGEDEQSFSPTLQEIHTAEELFRPRRHHQISKVAGLVKLEKLPKYSVPEVAFLGRSNVGKSSLIKAIFHKVPRAAAPRISISKKPGHTKSLQFFQVGCAFTLVDLPGYGENMPTYYTQSVETYLRTRKKLCRSFLLLDAQTGITDVDQAAIDMMEEFGKPYVMVLTKIDAASQHIVLRNLLDLQAVKNSETHVCFPQPFLVSAVTGAGIGFLQAFISYVTGACAFQGL